MKVLFLSNDYGLDRPISAYTHRLEKLRRALQHEGIETGFLSLREQPFRRPVLVHPLNLPFIRRRISNYDFIHAGGDAAFTTAFLPRRSRPRVIFDVHGDSLSEARQALNSCRGWLAACRLVQAYTLNAISYKRPSYFLVVSDPSRSRLLSEKRIPGNRISIVRNGVDLDLFRPQPVAPAGPFTVCYAGGFHAYQGIDNLVNAFALLGEGGNIHLKIIGFTAEQTSLKQAIASRLGPKVQLMGRLPQKELISELSNTHVFVIPRMRNRAVEVALPTKFAEYLALAKPVIVSNVDETAGMVERHNCGLVSEPNPEALAETFRRASDLTQAELNQMGQNGRGLAEREFAWPIIGKRYADRIATWSSS
jgi:glycosyltransferase involved in cell wall biosynthesis